MKLIQLLPLLLLFGCASPAQQQGVSFSRLPAWVPVNGTVTAQQVAAEVAKLAPGAQLLTSDGTFTLLDHDFAVQLVAWCAKELRARQSEGRLLYDPEGHDCDKFAKAFTWIAEVCAGYSKVHAQPLAARIFVRQVSTWGGVPGGNYGHAVVAIATTKGIIVVEPQSTQVGGCWAFLKDYPNAGTIFRVTIGG